MNEEHNPNTGQRLVKLSAQLVNFKLRVQAHAWHPATDLFETSEDFMVKVEIAGMCEDNFTLHYEGNLLTIAGQRKLSNPEGAFHRLEIPYGDFITSVEIPANIRRDDIQASYQDGFLIVRLPKAQPINIPIQE